VLVKKGLRRKTFVFTLAVITLVIIVSFGILYFALPGYYLRQKSAVLQRNADVLALELNMAASDAKNAELIADFAQNNNANVVAFDENNSLIPFMSSPFIFRNEIAMLDPYYINHSVVNEVILPGSSEFQHASFLSSLRIRSTNTEDGFHFDLMEGNMQGRFLFLGAQHQLVSLTRPVESGVIDHIVINATLQPIHEAQGVVLSLMPYILTISFLIALLCAYLFARELTKPILQISDAAWRMQQMAPDALSNLGTTDELGQLSENLDSLYTSLLSNIQSLREEMARTERLERSKTDFMRSAGHELKTPIAALGGIIEGMIDNVGIYKNRDKYLLESKGQVHKLSKLVHEILNASALSDVEAAEAFHFEEIDLSLLLSEALAPYRLLIEKKNLQLTKDEFSFIISTDRKLLFHTLSNLISNAVNYTQDGDEICVSFNGAALSIENKCEPLGEDLEKLFEPFYTLSYDFSQQQINVPTSNIRSAAMYDSSQQQINVPTSNIRSAAMHSRDKIKSGTGLGLYIVKRNLEFLGMSYQMEQTNSGVKFSIMF